jgi:hypothetical protein
VPHFCKGEVAPGVARASIAGFLALVEVIPEGQRGLSDLGLARDLGCAAAALVAWIALA